MARRQIRAARRKCALPVASRAFAWRLAAWAATKCRPAEGEKEVAAVVLKSAQTPPETRGSNHLRTAERQGPPAWRAAGAAFLHARMRRCCHVHPRRGA